MIGMLEMPLMRRLTPLLLAVAVLLFTLEMIRRRKLREEYALLWLGVSLLLLVLAIFPEIPLWLESVLATNYLTIIVMACFLFMGMILMHLGMVISKQAEQIRQLAQHVALLRSARGSASQTQITTAGEPSE